MTTQKLPKTLRHKTVVEAYRLDRYDNVIVFRNLFQHLVVEAYRLDRYDNFVCAKLYVFEWVVEAYRLDRYDNFSKKHFTFAKQEL